MDPPSRAMHTPRSVVMRSSVTGGLERVRALYRAPESVKILCVVPKLGRAQYPSVHDIRILATAFAGVV